MSKELIISVSPQETKAAILDNEQVVEIYIERGKEQSLVGSIYRGKVTKVLPGMQSAFVDIGLERDSFLYVSDFFEDTEEYDKIVSSAEEQVAKLEQGGRETAAAVPEEAHPAGEVEPSAAGALKFQDRRGRSRRSRRNRLRGKRFEEVSPAVTASPAVVKPPEESVKAQVPVEVEEFPIILPGESLAKYQRLASKSLPKEGAPSETEGAAVRLAESLTAEIEEETAEEVGEVGTPSGAVTEPMDEEEIAEEQEAEHLHDAFSLPANEQEKTKERASSGKHACASEEDSAADVTLDQTEKKPGEEAELLDAPLELSEGGKTGAPLSSTTDETDAATAVAPQEAPAETSKSVSHSQAQFRSTPGAPRFFRKNLDRRRRQHSTHEDRKEGNGASNAPLIGDLLKEGQEILVQISKEPLGTKGARITSHIALPGRYLVFMPTVDHIGVSRKIDSDDERLRLKRIIQENRGNLPGGFIVRTAGAGKGEDEFKSDIRFLSALWAEIKSKSDRKSAPVLIHRDLNLIQRLLRDQLSADFAAIRIDNETEYASILEFVNRFQPTLVNRVKLYTKDTPIFEEFGVQTEIDRALRSKVWLKSGGYIVIDHAEALVAIDVNTGKYVGKSNKLEDTIVKTNIEAAKEIARQIRLRDLGGIIVCDFIDMEDRKNRQKVTQTLEEALRSDKSPSKILQFNDFGLVAITRKRVKQSLLKSLCEPCSYCNGAGMVKSAQTVCYEIQTEVKKMARALADNKEITIRVNPEVARALKTEEASVVSEIETLLKKEVLIKSDPLLHPEHFDVV